MLVRIADCVIIQSIIWSGCSLTVSPQCSVHRAHAQAISSAVYYNIAGWGRASGQTKHWVWCSWWPVPGVISHHHQSSSSGRACWDCLSGGSRAQSTLHTLAGSQDKLDEFSDPRSELACDIWSRIFSFLFDFPQLISSSLAWYQCWTQALPGPARPAGRKLSLSRIRIKLINDDWPPLTGPWSHLAPAEERELL